jgi:tetratricopeptide (TPR) repeat protein
MHENPGELHYRAALAICLSRLSLFLACLERFDEAQAAGREALGMVSGLSREVAAWRIVTVIVYQHRTAVFAQAGWLGEAVDASRETANLQEALLKDYPNVQRFGFEVLRCRMNAGELLWRLDRPAEAAKEFDRFRELSEKLQLEDFETQCVRAQFLANSADPAFRNPREAIALAKKSVAAAPENSSPQLALGAALCRAGEYRDAIPPLKTATQLYDRLGAGMARFFLVMAHWQLGQKDEARRWYDEAIARHDDLRLGSPTETARVREEAETLMGINAGRRAKTQPPRESSKPHRMRFR